uniref:Uncharacterized protein n=1 Tax=Arundo donax TaxID=35708 RepID=A0A0A9FGW0_ARUDO
MFMFLMIMIITIVT